MGKKEEQLLDAATLEWRKTEQGYSLWADHATQPVMHGTFIEQELRPGLALHGTTVSFRQGISGKSEINAGLKLIVMLEGEISAHFGRTHLQLGGAKASCVLLSAQTTQSFKRVVEQAGQQRQVVLTISEDWLAQSGMGDVQDWVAIEELQGPALSSRSWQASPEVLSLAAKLLQTGHASSPLHPLQQESRALNLLLAALQQISPQQPTRLDMRAQQRIQQLLELFHHSPRNDWSLATLSHAVGSNPTTLQKQFRQSTGHSIAEYMRSYRLKLARNELQQGQSVTEAALNAGYNSPANFATAFKRQFGLSPREVRL
ncbi:helix-turn-helix transcriptional regulator [Iodobacter sp. HSC-16F04]|uniref:Helix-turn-helix transcriptional regulator n=1 Tax=Iodobacter violaceini TaxID=3044271 RepID=A0ABX0KQ84_9NEIS|nr:AraC family transcriptional regulator [Iodobacter violacea]NHQ86735.1 helix-turn-helix transcriptional regulator [Iodobacter violacea]